MRGGRGVTRCGSFIGSNFHRLFSISDEDRHSHQWTGQPIRRRLWGYDSPTPSRRLKIRCIGSPLPLSIGGRVPRLPRSSLCPQASGTAAQCAKSRFCSTAFRNVLVDGDASPSGIRGMSRSNPIGQPMPPGVQRITGGAYELTIFPNISNN